MNTSAFRMAVRRFYVLPIRLYKLCLSPYFGNQCRFYPTCSTYAIDAVMLHGIVKGTLLAVWRILRCNPWCAGGYDPVPNPPSEHPASDVSPARHCCGS